MSDAMSSDPDASNGLAAAQHTPVLTNKDGWDGKLRVEKKAQVVNAEILSDPEFSDDEAPPVDQIQADEDLMDEYEADTDEIDLVHCRVSSIPSLRLDRFTKVEVCREAYLGSTRTYASHCQKLCLRQNQISHIEFPGAIGSSLQDLDLYDNLISHIRGLDQLVHLTSLDLSFNKIKHIKNVDHLKELRDLYFVQNRIQKIENLKGMDRLRNLELAANRIRVCKILSLLCGRGVDKSQEVENLENLVGLEELWLGKNKITELKVLAFGAAGLCGIDALQNVSSLVNLKILSIQSNRLPAITGLESLPNLEELYISHNALTEISGLEQNHKLRVLDISNNRISQLTNIKHLEDIEELWASSNSLSSFDEIEKELSDKKALNTVYFEHNPLQTTNPALYRNKVRLALPQINQIDAIPPSDGSLVNTPAPLINISLPSAGNPETPSLNDIQIQCRGRQFGFDLNYNSCLDAFGTFSQGHFENPVQIGRRGTGSYARSLPWKWVSCMNHQRYYIHLGTNDSLTDDGRCVFDIVMKGTAPHETTSGQEIARAAWKLLNKCVRDEGRQGGIVSNIGRRGTLGIILRSYDPTYIQCGTVTEQYSAHDKCSHLLEAIPADVSPPIKWGPPNQAGVDKVLPYAWKLAPFNCRLNVWGPEGATNVRDKMSYYEMWTAGVMLAGVCARDGKAGQYAHLGQNGRLWVLLDDGRSDAHAQGGGSAAGNQTVQNLVLNSSGSWNGSLTSS
ncbi:MAG: hypothetical protein Q9218_007706 [Villophora microphyllina]